MVPARGLWRRIYDGRHGQRVSTRFRLNRVAMAAYAGFIALSAYAGSIGMISGLLPVRAPLVERLPFHSPVFGGIALVLIVGLPRQR
jgi:hypothetical protein